MVVKLYNHSSYTNPTYHSEQASGIDLRADIKEPVEIISGKITCIPTGLFIELPVGYEAQVRARSGLALNHGITLVNGIGTIDGDYRGEIKVILSNLTNTPYWIQPGERIAQLVFSPVVYPDLVYVNSLEGLSTTKRLDGGFGHSGKN